MVPYAERAVAAAQDAENAVRALARPTSGPIALSGGQGRLPAMGGCRHPQALRGQYPEVEPSLRTATSGRGQRSDPARQRQPSACAVDRDRSRDLDCELLFAEPLQVVCAPGHPRAGQPYRGTRRSQR